MGEKQGLTKNVEFGVSRKRHLAGGEVFEGYLIPCIGLELEYFHDIMAGIPRVYCCYQNFPMICVEEL